MLTHTSSLALVSSLLYTYKYTYIHTCIHTHTQTHTYSLALVSSLLYVYIHACARAHAHTHTYSLALVSSLLLLFQHGLGGWGEREGEPGGGRGGSWAALLLSQGVQLFVRITHRLSGCAAPVVMCVCVCVCVCECVCVCVVILLVGCFSSGKLHASITLCCMTRCITLVTNPHIHCVPRALITLAAGRLLRR